MSCIVKNCINRKKNTVKGISFHRLPLNETHRILWLDALGLHRNELGNNMEHLVCSDHFSDKFYFMNSRRLFSNAVPSIQLRNNLQADTTRANEIQIARGRLKGALQDLVAASSGESDNEDDEKKSVQANEPAESNGSYKTRGGKKTRNDDDSISKKEKVFESFVMKLFDRSLDLANYKENTPLYPICRAWMYNAPKANIGPKIEAPEKRTKAEVDLVKMVEEKKIQDITALPIPKETKTLRIPEREKDEKDYKNIIDLDYDLDHPPFTKEELLMDHKKRWKDFKTNWSSHNKQYQREKYATNFDILDIVLTSSDNFK